MLDPTPVRPPSAFKRFMQSDIVYAFITSPVAILAALTALVLITCAILAPVIAPQNAVDPAALNLMDGYAKPGEPGLGSGTVYLLGSDAQGRDVLSAVLYGMRISLLVGFASVLFALVVGVTLGLIAGYAGGAVDAVIMRVADIQLSFPAILIALLVFGIVRGFIPADQQNDLAVAVLIFAIGLANWAQFARTVRSSTMVEKNKDYVLAARVMGRSGLAIVFRHILPNVTGPVLVIATINLALAIIEEATLSYLGVGVPPTNPSLGTLIRVGQQYLFSGEWWILFFPAVALVLLALAVNLLGDWLRDALNPRLR